MTHRSAIRGNFFFYFMALGFWFPFLAPFIKESLALRDSAVGYLLMVPPVVALVAQPFWSYVADKSGDRSRIAALLTMFTGIALGTMTFVNSIPSAILVLVTWSLFNAALISIGDSIAFSSLGHDNRAGYARLRIAGTFGFLVSAGFAGVLFDGAGLRMQFPLYAVTMIAAALFIGSTPRKETAPHKGSLRIRDVYRNRNIGAVTIAGLLGSLSNQMAFVFLSIYLKQLGATNANIGIMWIVAAGVEAILLFLMGAFMARLQLKHIITIGIAAGAVRWFLAATANAWWQIIPLQAMHSISFAFYYVGSVTLIDAEAPPRLRSSAQAVFGLVSGNVSVLLGAMVSGIIAENLGYRKLLLICGAVSLVGSAVVLLFVREPSRVKVDEEAATA